MFLNHIMGKYISMLFTLMSDIMYVLSRISFLKTDNYKLPFEKCRHILFICFSVRFFCGILSFVLF